MHALCCSPIAQFFSVNIYTLYNVIYVKKKSQLPAAKVSELGAGAYFHQADWAAGLGLCGASLTTS